MVLLTKGSLRQRGTRWNIYSAEPETRCDSGFSVGDGFSETMMCGAPSVLERSRFTRTNIVGQFRGRRRIPSY